MSAYREAMDYWQQPYQLPERTPDPRLFANLPSNSARPAADEPEWGEVYPWPVLDRAAFYGLAGEIVEAISSNTEAAPVAMLLTLLVAFGNAVGDKSRALVGDEEHPGRLFATLVGSTSKGGKGTSLAAIKPILLTADEAWFSSARMNGFASGEAIVAKLGGYHRTDESEPVEKRALVFEPEFARLLTVNGRDGSTASQILRSAWDDGRLQQIRAKQTHLAEGAHLSLLGHVTPDELRSTLTANDIAGGFANRVLFACVRRAQRIPSPHSLEPALKMTFGKALRSAMEFGRQGHRLSRTPEAEEIWREFYGSEPERDDVVGAVTARSDAQRLRLSVVYALLDESAGIRPEHILAAEAVWRYCSASVLHLFGSVRGDRVQTKLLEALRGAYPDGLDGAAQHGLFGRNLSGDRLAVARQALERRELIRSETLKTEGRERLVSFAIPVRTNENIRTQSEGELYIRLSSFVRTPQNSDSGEVLPL